MTKERIEEAMGPVKTVEDIGVCTPEPSLLKVTIYLKNKKKKKFILDKSAFDNTDGVIMVQETASVGYVFPLHNIRKIKIKTL